MNSQILRSRADVEPLLLIQNDTADALTVPDRFSQDRNKGNFATGWYPSDHSWVPNRNVREIDAARKAGAKPSPDIYNAIGRQIEREIG